ncbi:S4 domain-containing protein YaaA [Anoxybacillus sp. J5B_2022]|uniref:S4 domain-containing protein YaaA n=1 Tax=Anoxybacillus sp. J5B_2022 TaxID=3003246 RepID=UPI0022866ABB|nr:S4 domain-containing protein YaaA [Anoxybacillus sp. J5B_2022]MCZ0754763.1 S4 domain-containing protein YaaA [Anoxybacillus sp. J5B_2022]
MKKIEISTETITLGQFLKLAQMIDTGGMAKWFLQTKEVYVNGERETRRGRKLKNGDVVDMREFGTFVVKGLE